MLDLKLLTIDRIVVHHVPSAPGGKVIAEPLYADALVTLPQEGIDMFGIRLAKNLGHKSHGIKVDFVDHGAGSFFQKCVPLMACDEEAFIAGSKEIADSLASAQGIRQYAPSKLLVISGTTGDLARPFLGVIKAETQDGLLEEGDGAQTTVKYLRDVFLTETQRLFKIGFVQQAVARPTQESGLWKPKDFVVHLFDHLLTGTETRSAAHYFYRDFLGTDVASSDKRLTQDFFEKTLNFLAHKGYPAERKIELGEALRSELRSQDQTISVVSFSQKHLPKVDQDAYVDFMARTNFPTHAITKNTEYIKSRLRRPQKFKFSTGVVISTPADQVGLVKVEKVANGLTTVVIQGEVESQS